MILLLWVMKQKYTLFVGPPLCTLNIYILIELFYLNSTLNFGIPTVLVFQLEVYYKVDRLLTGLTAQQKGTTARWYSNKTSLQYNYDIVLPNFKELLDSLMSLLLMPIYIT